MKRLFACFAVVAFIVTGTFAEGGILVGGGMVFSSLSRTGDYKVDGVEYSMLTGFNFDWNYWYSFNERMGIIAGIDFESRGSKATLTDQSIKKTSLSYFQIPVLFSYSIMPEIVPNIISSLSVSAGPEIGIFVKMRRDFEGFLTLKPLDYGPAVNISVMLINRFVLGAGYYLGLADIAKETEGVSGTIKNTAIKLFIDYKYNPKP
jgi:hypothetical protein